MSRKGKGGRAGRGGRDEGKASAGSGGQECPPHTGGGGQEDRSHSGGARPGGQERLPDSSGSGPGGRELPAHLCGMQIKSHKRRGEWAELQFMARAAGRGFGVSKPWGESGRYDVGLDYGGRYLRVQVKSTTLKVGKSYVCNTRPDNDQLPYTAEQIDFLAAYLIPLDKWYIIPVRLVVALRGNIWFAPHKKGHKYEPFLEAWELFERAPGR
jgi:hypothetical protein